MVRLSSDLFRGDNINMLKEDEEVKVSISVHNLQMIKGGTDRVIAGLCSDVKVSYSALLACRPGAASKEVSSVVQLSGIPLLPASRSY